MIDLLYKLKLSLWKLDIIKRCPMCGNKDMTRHGFKGNYTCDECDFNKNYEEVMKR